eukprot:CAMPEP_0172160118 /NCGR_PEP_ID=MMETSP1050-20130122/5379_1 /TAXON_ID=233186 /ORGANISM="Cryptomonas curvata, Strain CCAP979/52" /LENGTH=139 /DNA_ID=CAMNT_0012829843 /DNA_START=268 /DNA_END=684 /DNA_ORIENTATION=+
MSQTHLEAAPSIDPPSAPEVPNGTEGGNEMDFEGFDDFTFEESDIQELEAAFAPAATSADGPPAFGDLPASDATTNMSESGEYHHPHPTFGAPGQGTLPEPAQPPAAPPESAKIKDEGSDVEEEEEEEEGSLASDEEAD